jgi:hypothetical protein
MNPTDHQYGSTVQQLHDSVNALPLTGTDFALIATVAVAMIVAGILLRCAVARSRS